MPLLRRFVQFSFIITLVTAFTALFSLIYVMTGGGPGFGTTTLEFYIYQQAFSTGDFGTAATAGAILFVVGRGRQRRCSCGCFRGSDDA